MVRNYHLAFMNKVKVTIAKDRESGLTQDETMVKIIAYQTKLIQQVMSVYKNGNQHKVTVEDLFVNNREIDYWSIDN